jgi:hypothetical protein
VWLKRFLNAGLAGIRPLVRHGALVGLVCAQLSLAALLWWSTSPPQREAQATPHIISRNDHPYDPDWPAVLWVLQTKCTGCHRAGTERSDFSSYDALIAGKTSGGDRVIVPGRPDDSLLMDYVRWNHAAKLDSDEPDNPMMPPEESEWLTGGQLESLSRWITNGALQYRLPDTCSVQPLLEIDFPSAEQCRACHPKQYEEWSRSMHHYAQQSPVFEAFNLTLVERTGGTIGTFCSRCHTPVGTALGENGSRRNVHRSRLSLEGVSCVVCHRMKRSYYKSNARSFIEPGGLMDTCMYGPFDDSTEVPGTHPAVGRPHYKESFFCGSCHDVTNPAGVRLEEAFSEWQNSPAAKQGITCQACHMGPVQGIPIPDAQRPWGRAAEVPGVDPQRIPLRPLSDHTFSGPDYSLLPDTEFPNKLDWMYEVDYRDLSRLTPHQQKTLGDLRRQNRRQLEIATQKRYELLKHAAKIQVTHPSRGTIGQHVRVHVDVINLVAGHSFPTGFTAERQLWVQIVLRDPHGAVLFSSGDLDANGDLRDEHSFQVESGMIPFDRHLLNFQNKFVALTTRGTERSVVIPVNRDLTPLNVLRPARGISASFGRPPQFRIAKGSLPPLKTMGNGYPMQLGDCVGPHWLEVRLNFRHLPPVLLDQIGTPHLKRQLEVVVIDEYGARIDVAPHQSALDRSALRVQP